MNFDPLLPSLIIIQQLNRWGPTFYQHLLKCPCNVRLFLTYLFGIITNEYANSFTQKKTILPLCYFAIKYEPSFIRARDIDTKNISSYSKFFTGSRGVLKIIFLGSRGGDVNIHTLRRVLQVWKKKNYNFNTGRGNFKRTGKRNFLKI